jgi:hypothetical protein
LQTSCASAYLRAVVHRRKNKEAHPCETGMSFLPTFA